MVCVLHWVSFSLKGVVNPTYESAVRRAVKVEVGFVLLPFALLSTITHTVNQSEWR